MATPNVAQLELHGGVGYWTLCDGKFEVWDRGDGIAEVSPVGLVGTVSKEMVESWAAFDKSIGRPSLPVPVGIPISAGPIAFVHADQQPPQDETGYLDVGSAFPGHVTLPGSREYVSVESVGALEAVLTNLG